MAMHLSRCCRPLPGDDVIGLVHARRDRRGGARRPSRELPGVPAEAERAACRRALGRAVAARRAPRAARLSLQLLDPRLGFAQVAAARAGLDGTISSFRISRRVEGVAFATLEVEVRDLAHDEALAALGALAGVRNATTSEIEPRIPV